MDCCGFRSLDSVRSVLRYELAGFGILLRCQSSAILNGYWLLVKHNFMIMDLVTVLYFVAGFASTVLFGSTLFLRFGGLLVYLVLCVMAFGSLALRNPFTYQYAKQDWPKEIWDQPLFRSTNNRITGVWGGLFLAGANLLPNWLYPQQYIRFLSTPESSNWPRNRLLHRISEMVS